MTDDDGGDRPMASVQPPTPANAQMLQTFAVRNDRTLRAAELSDGTMRYLLWIAALLSPQPPARFVLDEPETSLHPDLLPALGRLIAAAAARTQSSSRTRRG